MGLRREALQIVLGAILFSLALQLGLIKSSGPFWDNVLWGCVVMLGSRFLALVLGGREK